MSESPEVPEDRPIEGGAVTVAYLHPNDVGHAWHESLVKLVAHDMAAHQRVIRGGWLAVKCGAGGLDTARNVGVTKFLTQFTAEWLFWVDTDMGFAPDTIDRLLEAADPVERPVVGGLCFAQMESDPDGMSGYQTEPRPTLFDWVQDHRGRTGFMGRLNYPVNQLVRVAGTGAACLLIHRTVLERIAEAEGPTWHTRIAHKASDLLISEDLSFCMRAGSLGIPVYVHTGVRTTHQKTFWLGEDHFWRWRPAAPATGETAVIVPTMGRPESAAPFMASLRASTGLATVYAVIDDWDTASIVAWAGAGAEVTLTGQRSRYTLEDPSTFSQKFNVGYRATDEQFMFYAGDDCRFAPGWLDHLQEQAGDGFHIVGSNDLGNPRVMAGEHATHFLIRRSYVDEVGASWDGPGSVCHEGYHHWFTDDEIVTAAKQRGVFAMALGSRTEHLHPAWGKAEMDGTYRWSSQQEFVDGDADLFLSRAEQFGGAR
jgi:hypothetical protein